MTPTEKAFRDAFNRLKRGRPERLAPQTKVSQNNIAKEAGRDPSALRKSRYPELIGEIQVWVAEHTTASAHDSSASQRRQKRSLQQKIQDLVAQRDHAVSLLIEADAKILDLVMELERLRASQPPSNLIQMGLGKR